jgi:sec-independent protein translocase protein TatC
LESRVTAVPIGRPRAKRKQLRAKHAHYFPSDASRTIPRDMPPDQFDPDEYRMTVGEHLEELRRRMVLGLIGFILALCLCFWFAQDVTAQFCKPLTDALWRHDINPMLVYDEVAEPFMVIIQISMVTAFALASPWIMYQLWQFVAAGLYPNERKYVTKFLPLSITLLISGMLFVYFFILPWTLDFDIGFASAIQLDFSGHEAPTTQIAVPPGAKRLTIPEFDGDPSNPLPNEIWVDRIEKRIKIFFRGEPRVISFTSNQLLSPDYKLSKYIDLVIAMLLAFGLCFQLPLVVLALERIGIIEVQALKEGRRYVYFGMAILAACITPGGDLVSMIGLTGPLILLYELGIWLCVIGRRKLDRANAA